MVAHVQYALRCFHGVEWDHTNRIFFLIILYKPRNEINEILLCYRVD